MGCGCKTGNNTKPNTEGLGKNKSFSNTKSGFSNLIIRVIAFLLSLFLVPIIMIAVIWFMFELFLLNKEIDMGKIMTALSSKIKPFNEGYVNEDDEDDDEDDDDDEFTEENYEMVDVEDITPIASK